MTEGAIAELAGFVAALTHDAIPEAIALKAKHHSLDTVGAALAGSVSQEAIRTRTMLAAAGHSGAASLWGTGETLAPREAALVNGIAAHAFELDDTGGCDHSGAVVLPALVAALPLAGRAVTGREFVAAVVAGYDVGRRVMEGFGGYVAHNGVGWHSTGTCGVFAAAAACASLLRLSPAQAADCLGVAVSLAGGTWGFIHDGAMTKRLHAGRAAESGLTAALLAREGFTGPRRGLDDVWGGFFATYANGRETKVERVTQNLGSDWMLRHAAIKPYASCRDTHAAVDAIGRLIERECLALGDIGRIEARLNAFLDGMVGGRDVSTLPAAQMSLPYAVAARVCFGSAGLSAYGDERRAEPALQALLSKISILRDESVTASWASSLSVQTGDGRRFEEPTTTPLGAPDNPVSLAQLRDKFDGLAALALPRRQADELAETMLNLERLDDVAALPKLLAA